MKSSFFVAAVLVQTCVLQVEAPLPLGAIVTLGGVAGLKLALAMKLLRSLGWFDVSRYGVQIRGSVENIPLSERVVPAPGHPEPVLDLGPTITVPVAILPYFVRRGIQASMDLEKLRNFGKDFRLQASQSAGLNTPVLKVATHGDASVDGSKGSAVQVDGSLRSPIVNAETRQKALVVSKRSIDGDSHVYERVFRLLREMDEDNCTQRLLCEVGADPTGYGTYGERVNRFMDSLEPLSICTTFYDYQASYHMGQKSGRAACATKFSGCKHDLRAIAGFIETS